jgi:hypothetical protein
LQTGTLSELSERGVIKEFLDSDELYYDVNARRIILK